MKIIGFGIFFINWHALVSIINEDFFDAIKSQAIRSPLGYNHVLGQRHNTPS